MKKIIIIKENIPKIKTFLDQEHINYEIHSISERQIYREPLKRFKKARPAKVDIFSDYGEALKDKELEAEKRLLEEMDDEEEWVNE
jgi:arsenate reductase-like glutaredoxin family protein